MFVSTLFTFFGACAAQAVIQNIAGLGGPHPASTYPAVNGYNALDGKYQHVIILSIDGMHTVSETSVGATDCRLMSRLMLD